jgi:hypothetical protein
VLNKLVIGKRFQSCHSVSHYPFNIQSCQLDTPVQQSCLITRRHASFTSVRIPLLAKKKIRGSAVVEQFKNKISRLALQILFHTSNRSTQTTWRCSIWRNKKIANLKHLVLLLLDMELPHQCWGKLRWTTCLIRHDLPTCSSGLNGLPWMSTNWRFAKRISHKAIQNLSSSLSRHSRNASSRR